MDRRACGMLGCFQKVSATYPKHLAVIPDGNRRHAQRRGVSSHDQSGKALQGLVDWCLAHQIAELSVFAWSSENWSRSPEQVEAAMQQFEHVLDKWLASAQTDIAFYFVSTSPHKLSSTLREKMHTLTTVTREHTALKCYVYVSYGFSEDVLQTNIGDFRASSAVPTHASDPDVLIRTSGEQRLSNFCMWHLRYAELIFIRPLFPDCDDEVWDECMEEYAQRKRRFGK